jgi:hypothetical protein
MGMMQKIRQEGLEHSQVMEIAYHLTDASGPRLTNPPGFMRAANYAKGTLSEWGLANSHLDPWGEFGKGWQLEKSYVAITAPYYKPLIAYPKAWCGGTKGLQNGTILVLDIKDSTDLDKYKGQLKGKILIMDQPVNYELSFKPDASRHTDEDLAKMAAAEPQAPRGGRPGGPGGDTAAQRRFRQQFAGRGAMMRLTNKLHEMAKEEGAIAFLSTGAKNHDGTLFTQGGGTYKGTDPANFLDVMLGLEDYNMILRLARHNVPVSMDMDIKTSFQTKDLQGYNVIAEIPGTDPSLKDEIVMLGGHLDSWHTGTGATDNAAGCSVMMEAIRILKTLGIQPRRTIRIALWSGEEEGLLGSRGYVKKTFADPADMKLLPEH